jgi:hypothetical protein
MAKGTWNPPKTPFLDKAQQSALERLTPARQDPRCLSIADQTILAVSSAQGVIDNGGFKYFFGADWPGKPPYSYFSEAYRRIGANEAASAIDKAAALFPFPEPERDEERRKAFMASLSEDNVFENDPLCGDITIWEKLEAYAKLLTTH